MLQLAIPSMTAQFVNVLYSIIDRMYIGHISENGALALAGAGICGPIVTLLTSFGTLVGIGGPLPWESEWAKRITKSRTGTGKFFSDAQYFFCSADCQLSSAKR